MRVRLMFALVLTVASLHAQLGPEHRFLYPTTYPSYPENALAIHDMDGDGDGDVLFNSAGQVWFYEQLSPETWTVRNGVGPVAASHFRFGDIDGDGIDDLVFLEASPSRIAFIPILGSGDPGMITDLITTVPALIDIQLGDVDGDLDIDLVFRNDGSPSVLDWSANDGNGVFGAPTTLLSEPNADGPFVNTFALADPDTDGDLDIVALAYASDELITLTNDGLGNFSSAMVDECADCYEVVCASFDQDPGADLMVAFAAPCEVGGLRLWTGNGDGSFGSPVLVASIDSWFHLAQFTALDADTDGDTDLLLERNVCDISNTPFVDGLRNLGNGSFEAGALCFPFASDTPKPFAVGDLNGDGPLDVVSTANDGLHVAFDGDLTSSIRLNGPAQPKHITAAQFTGSLLPDVILSGDLYFGPAMEGTQPAQMTMHENLAGIVSAAPHVVWQPWSASTIIGAYPADLDNDGDQDLLALRQAPWTGTAKQWCVFMNNGGILDSTSAVGGEFVLMLPDACIPHLGDVDADGDLDLVWRGFGYDFVTSENNGDGSFASPQPSTVGTFPGVRTFGVCDVDQDGAHDYVWIRQDSMSWGPYLDNGQAGPQTFLGMAPIQADVMSTTDLDVNGSEDLVLLSDDSIAFLINDGNNGFAIGEVFGYDGWSLSWPLDPNYALGDLDGNGFPDVVTIGMNGDIFYYPNFSGGDFGDALTLITGAEHSGRNDIALADMDGDSDLDVLTCSTTGAAAWLGNDGNLPTALPAYTANAPLTLFPNPMHDEARLVLPRPIGSDTRVQLIDPSGRVLRTLNGNGSSAVVIERGHLESGLYVLRVMRGVEHIGTARMVIH